MRLERHHAPKPYDYLPQVPEFTLESDDLEPGGRLNRSHVHGSAGGGDESPHLRWSGFPAETKSFAVTCFDPDAPTGCGWWHWQLINLPVDCTELPRGAGSADGRLLPHSATQMRNDYGDFAFGGAGPPPGDHSHHYYFAVHALDVDHLDLPPETTNAVVGFNLTAHTLARAVIVCTYDH